MSINEHNYDEYLIRYMENDLDEEERKETELYMLLSREAEEELVWLEKTRLKPDPTIVLANKASLYRKEESKPPVIRKMGWYSVLAVAATIAIVLIFVLSDRKEIAPLNNMATVEKTSPQDQIPVQAEKKDLASLKEEKKKKGPASTDTHEVIASAGTEEHAHTKTPINKATETVRVQTPPQQEITIVQVPVIKDEIAEEIEEKNQYIQKPEEILPTYKAEPTQYAVAVNSVKENKGGSLLKNALGFFKKTIKVERKLEGNEDMIALSFQTENISISRKFRSNF